MQLKGITKNKGKDLENKMDEAPPRVKTGAEGINPYGAGANKGRQIEKMFDSIAPAYDFMNTAMSFGMHRRWRDKALNEALKRVASPITILDIATGTGDVAFRLAEMCSNSRIIGIDLSRGMLKIAKKRLFRFPYSISGRMAFEVGDSLAMTFGNNHFELVTVAYGVRNFENLRQGLAEIHRVLAPGGTLCIIELSVPLNPVIKWGYNLYSGCIIPAVGKCITGDSKAYSYLPRSIAAAPQRDDLAGLLRECGFTNVEWHSLTLGTVTYYLASKE
ncbi:MAG: bifunctional demethylmenaquinone methyltransferase/2-methoxy-6-polyprenyl-1,4-benzoquinol methylase UbiE [Muribaculaceae bacterium]|nr:bifunctional demethylmenaquinone methyltransferase/2-methoxy-6-polyprenyl-1,4-benzoquinol methylase UbiE [Muribaculaceae bacterium]